MNSRQITPKTFVDVVAGPVIAAAAEIPPGLFLRKTLDNAYCLNPFDGKPVYLLNRIDTVDICEYHNFMGFLVREMVVTCRKDHYSNGETIETHLQVNLNYYSIIRRLFNRVVECTTYHLDKPIAQKWCYHSNGVLKFDAFLSLSGLSIVQFDRQGNVVQRAMKKATEFPENLEKCVQDHTTDAPQPSKKKRKRSKRKT